MQQAGHEIDVELISFINMGLQRIYSSHEKNRREIDELRLEMQYQEEFGHDTGRKGKLDSSEFN